MATFEKRIILDIILTSVGSIIINTATDRRKVK
jgi:hypothetical protein